MQRKSSDPYDEKRGRDGAEVFRNKKARWAEYWRQQAYPVMLLVRTADGEIRWMDVSAYLRGKSAGGKTVRQIVFDGERLDVMSVLQWRKKLLVASG